MQPPVLSIPFNTAEAFVAKIPIYAAASSIESTDLSH